MEPISMVMRRRMLEWFGYGKRRDRKKTTRAVAEMKIEVKCHT